MAWRVWSVDTRTGQKQSVIVTVGFTWANALNMGSSGSATILLSDARMKGMNFRDLFDPVRRTLVIEWNSSTVYAGIIWSWDYDYDTKRLTVKHADLWSILSRRILFTANLSTIEKQKLTLASKSLWDLARGVVEAGTAGAYSLPIFYQGTTGGTESRTWYGYEMPLVSDELEAIMNTVGGPDVVLDPRWSTDGTKLEYLMWDGTDPGGLIPVNLSANHKMLHGVKVSLKGDDLATVLIGTGEGSEVDLETAYASVGSSSIPHLVQDVSLPKEKVKATLQTRTNAELAAVRDPVEQWSASMNASDAFVITLVKLGRHFEIYSHGDPMIPDGRRRFRLIEYSGDLSETVKLELQEV